MNIDPGVKFATKVIVGIGVPFLAALYIIFLVNKYIGETAAVLTGFGFVITAFIFGMLVFWYHDTH